MKFHINLECSKEKRLLYFALPAALCFFLGWAFCFRDVYINGDFLLPRDNFKHHFPLFLYVTRHLKLFGSFPEWLYNPQGGVWFAPLANNFLLVAPYRWFGYWLTVSEICEASTAYKISLLLGMGMLVAGVVLLVSKLSQKAWSGLWAGLLVSVTAVALPALFQEQSLGTLLFIPYIGWAWAKRRESFRYLILTFSLAGFAMNLHYPHLLLIYVGILGIAGVVTRQTIGLPRLRALQWGICGLAFLFTSSPLLYSYVNYSSRLESPLRAQRGEIKALSFDEYERINRYVPSSLSPENIRVYLDFEHSSRTDITEMDDLVLHMTPALAFAFLFLIFFPNKKNRFHALVLILLFVCAIGIHGPVPRLLFPWFPGIALFRQWYHFSILFNFQCLLALVVVGEQLQETAKHRTRWFFLILVLFAFGVHYLSFFEAVLPALILFVVARLRQGSALFPLFVLWTLAGGIGGSRYLISQITTHLTSYSSSYFYRSGELKVGDLSTTYVEAVVRPRGSNGIGRGIIFSGSFPAKGIRYDGTVEPFPSAGLSGGPRGIRIEPVVGYRSFLLDQFDDGQWRVEGNTQEFKKSALQVDFMDHEVILSRAPSGWKTSLILMWAGLIVPFSLLCLPWTTPAGLENG